MELIHKPNLRNRIQEFLKTTDLTLPEFAKITPILGNETRIGEYYIEFYVGTPPQRFTAQIDTGSSDLAIPDIECGKPCGFHIDNRYNPNNSSSSNVIGCKPPSPIECPKCSISHDCGYEITYADNSGYSATVYTENMTLAGLPIKEQYFGSITSESIDYGYQFEPIPVDGIVGVAYPELSEIYAPTLFDNVISDNNLIDAFSMCLIPNGGQLSIGASSTPSWGNSTFVYTPIVYKLWYTVYMADIQVYGSSIGVNPDVYNKGGTIVDSGTTLVYIPRSAFKALETSFENNCKNNPLVGVCNTRYSIFDDYCVSLTASQFNAYPNINIVLGQNDPITLTMTPSQYLVKGYCNDPESYSIAIESGGGNASGVILGIAFMQQYEVIFDRANSQLGFSPLTTFNDCS